MKILFLCAFVCGLIWSCNPKIAEGVRKNDLQRDVELQTSKGTIVLRLFDSTPVHRNNFMKLVKQKFYDSVIFHRVINSFMVQAGGPNSIKSKLDTIKYPDYTIPPEFRQTLFHKKGALAAARMPNDVNPKRESSSFSFYIVQGKIFTDAGLDSVETFRLKRKLPLAHREVYKTIGGAPHLDQDYTIFGEVVRGLNVVDSIASVMTNKENRDRPLVDVEIKKARLVRRK